MVRCGAPTPPPLPSDVRVPAMLWRTATRTRVRSLLDSIPPPSPPPSALPPRTVRSRRTISPGVNPIAITRLSPPASRIVLRAPLPAIVTTAETASEPLVSL